MSSTEKVCAYVDDHGWLCVQLQDDTGMPYDVEVREATARERDDSFAAGIEGWIAVEIDSDLLRAVRLPLLPDAEVAL